VRAWIVGACAACLAVVPAACREPVSYAGIEPGPRLSAWLPDSAAVLAHETVSGVADTAWSVLGDSASWAQLWSRLYGGRQPQPPLPLVDFSRYRVVVAAMGSRGSSGYDVRVDSVVTYETGPVVYLVTVQPGASCVTLAVITAPVEVLRVPLLSSSFGFRARNIVRDCQ